MWPSLNGMLALCVPHLKTDATNWSYPTLKPLLFNRGCYFVQEFSSEIFSSIFKNFKSIFTEITANLASNLRIS